MKNALSISSLLLFAACSHQYEPAKEPPQLRVLTPERAAMREGIRQISVAGTYATNALGVPVKSIEINGVEAEMSADGTFSAVVPLTEGATMLHTVATDAEGTAALDTRTIVAGTFRPHDTVVGEGMSMSISDIAFDTLGQAAGEAVASADLGAMVAPLNPVLNAGAEEGRDCLYVVGDIAPGLDIGEGDINLVPYEGGLQVEIDLRDVHIPVHTEYEVACIDGSTDISVSADRAVIRGDLNVAVIDGQFTVSLENAFVDFEGFDLDASGLPGDVLDLFSPDQLVGDILSWGMELFLAPMVENALAGIPSSGVVDMAGNAVELTVSPAGVDFNPAGAEIRLNTRMFVEGAEKGPGFVYTDNQLPPERVTDGIQLALADDALNQLLGGLWNAGAMNFEVARDVGQFDAMVLQAMLPPVVSADPTTGDLRILIGDMGITLMAGGAPQAKVAANIEMRLQVEPARENASVIRLALQPPTLWFNIVEDEVPDITGMNPEDFEEMMKISMEKTVEHMLPFLQAVPLPSLAGIKLTDIDVSGAEGYMVMTANVR